MFKLKINWVLASFFWLFAQSTWVGFVDAKPDVPVIFLHGLNGDETEWQAFGNTLGWTFGGCPIFATTIGKVVNFCSTSPYLSNGDFYRMRFSDNQQLTLDEQAQELQAVIDTVLTLTGKTQVILVAHSMGGLAARDYLQFSSRYPPDKVRKLVTVGTPHGGLDNAVYCQESGLCWVLGFEPSSIGMAELRPDISTMMNLNNLPLHPLPAPVRYTSIIGTGTKVIGSNGIDGDGVVTAISQNLGSIVGAGKLRHTAISIPIQDRAVCDKGYYLLKNETHTCESTDSVVWTRLLQELQVSSCNYYASGDPVLSGYGAPWNVLSAQRELLLKTYCSPNNTDIVIGNNSPQMIVYHWGYQWDGTRWSQVKLQCAGKELSSDWCAGEAAAEISTSSPWYVGYTCTSVGSQWKCGCRDAACTQPSWQLQGVKK